MQHIVLDTNCLIQSISPKSRFHIIWQSLFDGSYSLCISTEIIEEYHEILQRLTNTKVTNYVMNALLYNPYTSFISPYYKFNLISADPEDNKFVDCAIAANAKFIVTNDHHFDVLKHISFPRVEIINIEEFYSQLTV